MDTDKEKEIEEKIEKKFEGWCCSDKKRTATQSGSAGMVWFLGFIGAAIYYVQTASDFWDGVVGVLKALVWPAFLIYEALKTLGM
ncbi:MAG: hypothetical protein AAB632_01595 [Patescibacteria group bacterium]